LLPKLRKYYSSTGREKGQKRPKMITSLQFYKGKRKALLQRLAFEGQGQFEDSGGEKRAPMSLGEVYPRTRTHVRGRRELVAHKYKTGRGGPLTTKGKEGEKGART